MPEPFLALAHEADKKSTLLKSKILKCARHIFFDTHCDTHMVLIHLNVLKWLISINAVITAIVIVILIYLHAVSYLSIIS